jgi:hypothetical protein
MKRVTFSSPVILCMGSKVQFLFLYDVCGVGGLRIFVPRSVFFDPCSFTDIHLHSYFIVSFFRLSYHFYLPHGPAMGVLVLCFLYEKEP